MIWSGVTAKSCRLAVYFARNAFFTSPTQHGRNLSRVDHSRVRSGHRPSERNAEVAADPSKLERLIELGSLGQVTAQSLAGVFGNKLQKLSLELCRRNAVHVLASDAHDSVHRPFGLNAAYVVLEKELGPGMRDYMRENSQQIVANGEVIRGNHVQKGGIDTNCLAFFPERAD